MSVSVTYAATCTVRETLATNTGSASDSSRVITHDAYNETATLSATSTPPATTCAHFLLTLSAGAATIDLRALTGTNGASVDLNGLKVQVVRVKNLGANSMVFKSGGTNGHTGVFTATNGQIVQPSGHVMVFANDAGDDVDATHKTWDVTGTGSQTAEVTIVAG